MLTSVMRSIFGDPKYRNFKKVKPLIAKINGFFEQYEALSDEELAAKTPEFRERLAAGETLEDLLPEAFAAVKQACKRLCGESWEAGGIVQEWKMIPFDVQLCGAIYLHRGNVAEMATGEGKTLVASMPLYLNALEGKGAHLVTVNDYLARRDSEWMGRVFNKLGMTVGVIISDMSPAERRVSYNSDVTYGTNNEFGFDYLRDNMAWAPENLVQRGYHYGIVDEVDSVLIDEARTPLIISGQVDRSTHQFDAIKPMVAQLVHRQTLMIGDMVAEAERLLKQFEEKGNKDDRFEAGRLLLLARKGAPKHKRFIRMMSEAELQRLVEKIEHDYMLDKKMPQLEADLYFVIDEKGHSIDLTEKGRLAINPENPDLFLLRDVVEDVAGLENDTELADEDREQQKEAIYREHEERSELLHNISQLLRAYVLYERDKEYVVQDNKVLIVDEFTGRIMNGRRWSDGLHQAVECKEGVAIEKETQTLATITLQNYFRMYKKLSGMTGTAETEAAEFAHTYKMDAYVIPTHRPLTRQDYNDLIFKSKREKYNAIVEEVARLNRFGLPILVGTASVEVSETLSKLLKRAKISHSVLNAKEHAREAQIVQNAGLKGAVTIATNMAGRGTDIKLGPGVLDGEYPEKDEEGNPLPPAGLQIIGSERHESRRIDRQLRGRAGRQGDPGSSRFFVSIEDDLMRLFATDWMQKLLAKGFEDGEALSSGLATRSISSAQKKIEAINFEQRKRTLDYDNVMNSQREVIYGLRRRVLLDEGAKVDVILEITAEALSNEWSIFCSHTDEHQWDVQGFKDWVRRMVPLVNLEDLPEADQRTEAEFLETVHERIAQAYAKKTEIFGEEIMNVLARMVVLQVIDTNWRDHLLGIDEMRQGIHLRSFGQKDPKVEYEREASLMFEKMRTEVFKEAFEKIYRATIVQERADAPGRMSFVKEEGRQSAIDTARSAVREQQEAQAAQQVAQAAEPQPNGHVEGEQSDEAPAARPQTYRRVDPKVGPNDPCPCGSGRKYKKCHGSPAAQSDGMGGARA